MGETMNESKSQYENVHVSKARKRYFDMDDHRITAEELCSKYDTDASSGLTRSAAEARLARDGKNVINLQWKSHQLFRFLRCMFCGVTLLLWAMTFISMVVIILLNIVYNGSMIPNVYIFFALLFDALFIGICFSVQAKKSKLTDIVPPAMNPVAEVIRDGTKKKIPVEELVVGDLILLKLGDQIPADIRLIETQNFKVENFTLTGMHESTSLHDHPSDGNPFNSSNVAYFPGKAIEGSAKGIVIRTGNRTFLGWLVAGAGTGDKFNCPVTHEVIQCLNKASAVAAVVGFIFVVVFWFTSEDRNKIDAATIACIVVISWIPHDLLPTMILGFTIYARKMAAKTCIVKNILALQKIPFLGIIYLNKPGVLTLNTVNVTNLYFDEKTIEVWGGTKVYWKERSSLTFKELVRCAAICNEAVFSTGQTNVPLTKREVIGEPNEAAIFKFLVHTIGEKVQKLKKDYPKIYWSPYNESDKFQVSVHEEEGSYVVVMIGEPGCLLSKCTNFSMSGRPAPIGENFLRGIDKACVQFAKSGDIIKCVIEQSIPKTGDFDWRQFKLPETGFLFLGMISLADVPRPNIAEAVAKCRQAGIKVILTTSDHPIVARSFARHIGVITETSQTMEERHEERGHARIVDAVVIDGNQLNQLSAKRMQMILDSYSEIVFARTSPIQKLMLIAACQQNSSVVAVVGGTADDVLVMKKADMSISLHDGESRRPEMKADVYLSDDPFNSLATCIEEGRTIYENLKKCSALTLAANVAEVTAIGAYCFLGLPLPLNPRALLMTEILLKCFPAVALVFEKGDPGIMKKPPSSINGNNLWPRQLLFTACAQLGLTETFACFFTYFVIMMEYGWTPLSLIGIRDSWDSKAITDLEDSLGQKWTYEGRKELEYLSQTGYFYTLILMQCANIFVCKNQRVSLMELRDLNWMIAFSILFNMTLVTFLMYLPKVSDFSDLRPLKPLWWLLPLPFLFLLFFYEEVKKFIVRKSPTGWLAREILY